MTLVGWPDVALMTQDYLDDVLPGVTCCLDLPPAGAFLTALPIVQVHRIGGPLAVGTWTGAYLADAATIDLDVWTGPGDVTALETMAATLGLVRAALVAMLGDRRHGGSVIRVTETAGPGERPAPSQGLVRRGCTWQIKVRPVST